MYSKAAKSSSWVTMGNPLASPGAIAALPRVGFTVCADRAAVRDLRTGTVELARILGVGGHNEPWWCRTVVLGAARLARHGRMVRLSTDAKHLDRSGPHHAVLAPLDPPVTRATNF